MESNNFDLTNYLNGLKPTTQKAKRNSIYKDGIFSKNKEEAKKQRRATRNKLESFLWAIFRNPKSEQDVKSFINFYETIYRVQDFTLQSVTMPDDEESQKVYSTALLTCKKYKEQNKK